MRINIWKILLSILWIMIAINLFRPLPPALATTLHAACLFLVFAHLGEYLVFRKTIAERPESTALGFLMTFFFGVLYWKDFSEKPWYG